MIKTFDNCVILRQMYGLFVAFSFRYSYSLWFDHLMDGDRWTASSIVSASKAQYCTKSHISFRKITTFLPLFLSCSPFVLTTLLSTWCLTIFYIRFCLEVPRMEVPLVLTNWHVLKMFLQEVRLQRATDYFMFRWEHHTDVLTSSFILFISHFDDFSKCFDLFLFM